MSRTSLRLVTVACLLGVPSIATAAWTPLQNLSADADATAWPDIAVTSDGTLHAVWTDQTTRELKHGSRPLAGSWSVPEVVGSYAGTTAFSDGDIAVAVAPDGTVHIIHADDSSGHSEIYHRSKPPGGSWSGAVDISQTPGTRSEFPDVAVTPDGTVHAIWIDATPSGGICCSETYYASKAIDGGWSAAINISNNSRNEYTVRVGVGMDNSVHILTAQEDGGPGRQNIYYYAKSPGGSFTAGEDLTNGADMGRNMGGVIKTPDGTVHVVYYENYPSEVIYRSKPACGAWSSPFNLSSNATSSSNPDITADGCGTLHVAWMEDAGQVLYTGLSIGGSWSTPNDISAGAPPGDLVKLAAAGSRGSTTGTIEALFQGVPVGVSDVFFTEAALFACAEAPIVAVFDPEGLGRTVQEAIRVIPNPASGRARFRAPAAWSPSQFKIFDTAGRVVRTLELGPGLLEAEWDGRDDQGVDVGAGVYWVRTVGVERGLGTRVVLVR